MAIICPTITAYNLHDYREQIDRVAGFAQRLHIDFMDGEFAAPKSVELNQAWWPENVRADLHLMYWQPAKYLEKAIELKPEMIILHAEADGRFAEMAHALSSAGIKLGLALLQSTPAEAIMPVIDKVDAVLIFSGRLGRHGGQADLKHLDKVRQISRIKAGIEIGWDGGIDENNAARLASGGVDVLNVGGFIHGSADPPAAYAKLKQMSQK